MEGQSFTHPDITFKSYVKMCLYCWRLYGWLTKGAFLPRDNDIPSYGGACEDIAPGLLYNESVECQGMKHCRFQPSSNECMGFSRSESWHISGIRPTSPTVCGRIILLHVYNFFVKNIHTMETFNWGWEQGQVWLASYWIIISRSIASEKGPSAEINPFEYILRTQLEHSLPSFVS